MSITVKCGGCGKQYRVDEKNAGKRVRCKNCAQAMVIPAPAAAALAAEEDPLEALVRMEQSASLNPDGAGSAYASTPPAAFVPPTQRRSTPEYAKPAARKVSKRPAVQNDGLRELIDFWLPRGLVLVFYAPVLVLEMINAFHTPLPPITILFLLVGLALLVYVMLPIAAAGLRMAGGAMGFAVPDDPRLKIFAAYCPVPASVVIATVLMVGATGAYAMAHPGTAGVRTLITAVGVGVLLGLSVSFFLIWLLFHLRFAEAIVAWLLSSIFYVIGGILAGVVILLLLLVVGTVLDATGYKPPIAAVPARSENSGSAGGNGEATIISPPAADSTVQSGQGVRVQSNGRVTEVTPMPNGTIVARSWAAGTHPDEPELDDVQKRALCETRLRKLGQAMIHYATAHSDRRFGDIHTVLIMEHLSNEDITSPYAPARSASGFGELHGITLNMPGDTLLACDLAELRQTQHTHVLFVSGDVRWVDRAEFIQIRDQAMHRESRSGRTRRNSTAPDPHPGGS